MGIKLASAGLNARAFNGDVSQGALSVALDAPAFGVDLAAKGTLSVSLSVYNGKPGANYAPHVAIVTPNVTGFAGEELTTPEWDASVHRVEYWHDSGDIHAGNWRFDQRIPFKDRRTMIGHRSVHVYQREGSYGHTCFAYDQAGNWGSASVVIEVGMDAIQPDRIIVVAQDGDFTNAPFSPPTNRVQTWDEARLRYVAIGDGPPRAIYFKRGETWDTTGLHTINLRDTLVDAWGVGAKPHFNVLPGTGSAFRHVDGDTTIKIRNLSTSGHWSSVSEGYPTGQMSDYLSNWDTGMLFRSSSIQHTADILFDNCDGSGSSWTYIGARASEGQFVVHECSLTDFKDYFAFGASYGSGSATFLGCKSEQHLQSACGGLPRNFWNTAAEDGAGWYPNNGHNHVRMGTSSNLLLYACDFFGRHGWTVQMRDVYDNQPGLRQNSNGDPNNKAAVINCWMECSISSNSINNSDGTPVSQIIVAYNIVVADPSGNCIGLDPKGCTVKGNLCIVPNAGRLNSIRRVISVGFDPASDEHLARNEVYSNTIVDLLGEDGRWSGFEAIATGGHPGTLVENNIYYAPNRAVPQTADGPLDMTTLPFPPRFLGHRKSYDLWRDHTILPADIADGGSILLAYQPDRNGDATSAASFAGHFGKHRIFVSDGPVQLLDIEAPPPNAYHRDVKMGSVEGRIGVSFEAGGVRITNTSGLTWPSGAYLSAWLHRGSTLMAMDTSSATPLDSLVTGRPLAASGADGAAASGLVSLLTLDGQLRKGTGLPGAPAGTPSKGAYEVA